MPSSSKSPAFSAAARTCSISVAASEGLCCEAAKNGRPVLVQMAPGPGKPKREPARRAGERHTSSTAREPMCFSSHSTEATPSAR